MKSVKLYPPGGGEPVTPHPSRIETMKANGWKEEQPKQPKQPKEDK